jgi:hypothetical protein
MSILPIFLLCRFLDVRVTLHRNVVISSRVRSNQGTMIVLSLTYSSNSFPLQIQSFFDRINISTSFSWQIKDKPPSYGDIDGL